MPELRDYQAAAIERLRESMRQGHRRPILQAPTGYGKTLVASDVVRMARAKDKRVVFCVPAIALIDQTLEAFGAHELYDIGVIQAKHVSTDWRRPIQIASVQTLARREFPQTDLVIIDECHRVFDTYMKWMAEQPRLPFIGLSATPWTRGLGKHFDDLIISATTQELIDAGHLSRFRVFAPAHPDLSKVSVVAGDYHEGQLSDAMSDSALVADVVETWMKHGENRATLIFAVDRAHAKKLQQQFLAAGINAAYQDMRTPDHERRSIKAGFHDGRYPVVCNVGTLTTGVDWDVRCIVLCRPTRSEILFVQIIGRGLRPKAGDPGDCLILDHSDTTMRLGFVTDIYHDTLNTGKEAGKQEAKAPLPKECPHCAYLMPPRVNPCPACGHLRGAPRSDIENVEGELIELTARGSAKPAKPRVAFSRVRDGRIALGGSTIPLEDFYAELMGYSIERGYSPGWAAHQYKDAVGNWPGWQKKELEPLDPSPPVRNWIKSRLIAYAKRRRA